MVVLHESPSFSWYHGCHRCFRSSQGSRGNNEEQASENGLAWKLGLHSCHNARHFVLLKKSLFFEVRMLISHLYRLFIVGLLSGGQPYPWSSAQVLAPLIIGIVGLFLWFLIERYYAEHPTVPFELLLNRTSFIGYFTTFVHGIMALTLFYYWYVWRD